MHRIDRRDNNAPDQPAYLSRIAVCDATSARL
jgi:hypothetical protein